MKLLWAFVLLATLVVVGSVLPSPFRKVREAHAGGPLLTGSTADSATLATLDRTCANCHSNETKWPWYANIAPASWLLERDVMTGRKSMNFSRWPEYGDEGRSQLLDAAAKQIQSGAMPPSRYLALHPEARLTPEEKKQLTGWLSQESGRLASTQK